ncbi:MAG: hypothetical protein NC123_17945 [Butyrivibrio sp.]|nr:hypothetical protein [Acetatifactor muris]MCM1561395.1 hypothetical protein [Butyrivibrio sp.]
MIKKSKEKKGGKNKKIQEYLRQILQREPQPERLEETITSCLEILREQNAPAEEPRTGFFRYLSEVFRFEGIPLFGLQAAVLLLVCLTASTAAGVPKYIPAFMPLFALAAVPVIFKSRFYGMSEIEAATRASGAQIILAKLILAGAANLVCMTVLLCLEVHLQGSREEIGRMILYCLVPYLVCMTAMLRMVRLRKQESIPVYAAAMAGASVCLGMSAGWLPGLYETAATGLWITAFLVFAVFFTKEICFIIKMRKEGKMYGIIA